MLPHRDGVEEVGGGMEGFTPDVPRPQQRTWMDILTLFPKTAIWEGLEKTSACIGQEFS